MSPMRTCDAQRDGENCGRRFMCRQKSADFDRRSQLTTEPLATFFKSRKNRVRYVNWMKSVTLDHVEPGQLALVVCKKKLIAPQPKPGDSRPGEIVPDWSLDDQRFNDPSEYSEQFGWDLDGRRVSPERVNDFETPFVMRLASKRV
jgi:hypothetical protein